jgi:hypothetical protein
MPARTGAEDGHFEVTRSGDGSVGLRTLLAFDPGEVLVAFRVAALLPAPVRHSIQVGPAEHALVDPAFLRFTNHSCDPNVVLDTRARCVRAIRRLEPGEAITYFYPSTEWSMAEPFVCSCGAARCLLTIAGAAYLSAEVLARYQLADHITLLLWQRTSALPLERS